VEGVGETPEGKRNFSGNHQPDQRSGQRRRSPLAAGFVAGIPVLIGYLPVGVAFGLLARTEALPAGLTLSLSLFVFAGASQFMAVSLLASGSAVWGVIAATFLLNLRHLLMSSSLVARHRFPSWLVPVLAFGVTDETFAVASSAPTAATPRENGRYVLGLEVAAYGAWVSATAAGYAFGSVLSERVAAAMGVALYCLFTALLVPRIRKSWFPAAVAAGAAGINSCLVVGLGVAPGLSFVIALVASAGIGAGVGRHDSVAEAAS
jgi:4-azaleucine resistance transporter AzlC